MSTTRDLQDSPIRNATRDLTGVLELEAPPATPLPLWKQEWGGSGKMVQVLGHGKSGQILKVKFDPKLNLDVGLPMLLAYDYKQYSSLLLARWT